MKDHHDKPGAIAIDKGVPMPPRGGNSKPTTHFARKYPFPQMEVGDSFFTYGSSSSVRRAAQIYAVRSGARFSCLAVTENGIEGTRVWRVA